MERKESNISNASSEKDVKFHMYNISIRGCVKLADAVGSFTLLAFECFTPSTSWFEFKRYTEIWEWKEKLKSFKFSSELSLEKFPGKTLFAPTDETIRIRMEKIHFFFQQLIKLCPIYPELRRSIHKFFNANPNRFAFTNDIPLLKVLLEEDNYNSKYCDAAFGTPLHYSAAQGRVEASKLLLKTGASPDAIDQFGLTPIQLAERRGYVELANELRKFSKNEKEKIEKNERDLKFHRLSFPQQYLLSPENRRVLIIVNPNSGKKMGKKVLNNVVLPILKLCKVEHTVVETKYSKHGTEIAKNISIDSFDCIMSVSGDGLTHEIFNGLYEREDRDVAIKMPVILVNAGTSGVLAINSGYYRSYESILGFLKGVTHPIDMLHCEFPETGKSVVSFLMASFGVIPDIDINSETIRWMGEFRYDVYGFTRVISKPKYKATVKFTKASNQTSIKEQLECVTPCAQCHEFVANQNGKEVKEDEDSEVLTSDNETWTLVVASNLKYLSSDTYAGKYCHFADGLMDLILVKNLTRVEMAKFLLNMGDHVLESIAKKKEGFSYEKVDWCQITPLTNTSSIDIDGEDYGCSSVIVSIKPHLCVVGAMSLERD